MIHYLNKRDDCSDWMSK